MAGKIGRRFLRWTLACAVLLFCAGSEADGLAEGSRTRQVLDFQEVRQVPPGQEVALQFDVLKAEDFVVVAPTDRHEAALLCAVIDASKAPVPIRYPGRTIPWVSRFDHTITVEHPNESEALFVYLRVPHGTPVVLVAAGETVYSGAAQHSIIWEEGAWVQGQPTLNGAGALGRLVKRFHQPQVRAGRGLGDPYTVPFELLERVRYVEPSVSRGSGPVQETLLIKLLVNEAGELEKVGLIRGSRRLFDRTRSELMEWRFKPYRVEGKPVPFRTLVLVPVRAGDGPAAGGPPSAECCRAEVSLQP